MRFVLRATSLKGWRSTPSTIALEIWRRTFSSSYRWCKIQLAKTRRTSNRCGWVVLNHFLLNYARKLHVFLFYFVGTALRSEGPKWKRNKCDIYCDMTLWIIMYLRLHRTRHAGKAWEAGATKREANSRRIASSISFSSGLSLFRLKLKQLKQKFEAVLSLNPFYDAYWQFLKSWWRSDYRIISFCWNPLFSACSFFGISTYRKLLQGILFRIIRHRSIHAIQSYSQI